MAKIKAILVSLVLATLALAGVSVAYAQQTQSDWAVCPDGSGQIVRCATYNCPNGDTNGDGICSVADDNAKLTDLRNDALCANPPSGCGQVYYYNSDGKSCATRVKDTESCPIAAETTFNPTVTPTPSVTTTPTKKPTTTPQATGSATLPKTGFNPLYLLGLLAIGGVGAFIFSKYDYKLQRDS